MKRVAHSQWELTPVTVVASRSGLAHVLRPASGTRHGLKGLAEPYVYIGVAVNACVGMVRWTVQVLRQQAACARRVSQLNKARGY